jgi:hypothetical protein
MLIGSSPYFAGPGALGTLRDVARICMPPIGQF